MKTPLGWARANLVYHKLSKVPKYGSLMESMCLLLWKELLDIDVAQARAQAQASIGGEEATKAFKDYSSLVFREKVKQQEQRDLMQERFRRVAQMGPISFQPVEMPKAKGGVLPRVKRKKK